MSLNYLLAQPDCVEDKINPNNSILIYPIKLKYYEEFSKYAGILYLSKNHFDENFRHFDLLELLFISHQDLGFTIDSFIDNFCKLFNFVTLRDVSFSEQDSGFIFYDDIYNENENIKVKKVINQSNYEQLRDVIMRQNLIIEKKIYKTKLMTEWVEKAMRAKQKTAAKITLEDVVSTISVGCGKHYWELEDYTIYQIYSDFYRLGKIIEHDITVQFKCSQNYDPTSISIENYSESLDLYHNPYDDLFVSSDKLSGLNKVMKQS